MLSHARRLALPCALVTILTAPLLANMRIALDTPESRASFFGDRVAVEWLGPRSRQAQTFGVENESSRRCGRSAVERLAQRYVRNWWPEQLADARASAILDGISCYLQTRAIEQMFDYAQRRTAYGFESRSYLGGQLRWYLHPLRISRHVAATRDPYAAVFDSLERWIGIPALQGAMFAVAHLPGDRLSAASIIDTISDAAGQDLSWAFDAATTDVNYAVDSISPNSVTVTRRGTGMFTGRTAARVGDFDSGDAVRLKVVFADGATALTSWDGRDATRTFTFQGPSTVVAAYLDPDRIVTLDRNRLDNAIVPPSPTNVPVTKWTARWMVWLQHTMLSYGFLA